MKTEARHLIAEYWGCGPELLDDEPALRAALLDASVAASCEVLSVVSHRFEPHGVTVVALLSESHASIHTWPEEGYAAVDVYTCGDGDPLCAHELLLKSLGATSTQSQVLERGRRPLPISRRRR